MATAEKVDTPFTIMSGDAMGILQVDTHLERGLRMYDVFPPILESVPSAVQRQNIRIDTIRALIEQYQHSSELSALRALGMLSPLAVKNISRSIDWGSLVSRRGFVFKGGKLAALGGALAACASQPQQTESTPPVQPTPARLGIEPESIPDEVYAALPNNEKALKLIEGAVPVSWDSLTLEEIAEQLRSYLYNEFIPAYTQALGLSYVEAQAARSAIFLVKNDEEALSLLTKIGKDPVIYKKRLEKSAGITIRGYNEATGALEKRLVIIPIEDTLSNVQEVIDELRALDPIRSMVYEPRYVRSQLIVKLTDVCAHEITHLTTTQPHFLTVQEIGRLESMYADTEILFEGKPIQTDFIVDLGMRLDLKSKNTSDFFSIYERLDETYRAYLQYIGYSRIAKDVLNADGTPYDTKQLFFRFDPFDRIPIRFIQRLHDYLGISEDEFISNFRNKPFLTIVDFYKSKLQQKGYVLTDEEIAVLYNEMTTIMNASENQLYKSYDAGKFNNELEVDIGDAAWGLLQKFLEEKRYKQSGSTRPRVQLAASGKI